MEATMKKFVPPTKEEADQIYNKWKMGRLGKNPDGSRKKRSSMNDSEIEDNG